MRTVIYLLVIVGTICLSGGFAEEREVRFWVGDRNNRPKAEMKLPRETGLKVHLDFIRQTLGPATLVAGHGALDYYAIYIPPKGELPKDAAERYLQFSEAALPSYVDTKHYDEARKRRKEYGPLHGKENMGFNSALSYSATPKFFEDAEVKTGIKISRKISDDPKKPKKDRIAYNLRPRFLKQDPNWQEGVTLVWLAVRKDGVADVIYKRLLAFQFQTFSLGKKDVYLKHGVDGHYARVDKNHVLHFIHVPDIDDVEGAIKELHKIHKGVVNEILIDYHLVVAEAIEPYAPEVKEDKDKGIEYKLGWYKGIDSGKAVNVKFVPGDPKTLEPLSDE